MQLQSHVGKTRLKCKGEKMTQRIGIIGTRRRNAKEDYEAVLKKLKPFMKDKRRRLYLVSGGCPLGGDAFAEKIAKRYGYSITIHYPDWGIFGNRAGFVRNQFIAQDSDILIACVARDRIGGTEDTIKKFKNLHTKSYIRKNLILVEEK